MINFWKKILVVAVFVLIICPINTLLLSPSKILVSNIQVQAQTSGTNDIINDRTAFPIPLNRTDPIAVYFKYGNQTLDTDIQNSIADVLLNDPGNIFAMDNTQIFDIYNGSPTRTSSDTPPGAPASCDAAFQASSSSYPILKTLSSSTNLIYGLQTSRDTNNPGGASAGTLKAQSTGCIKITLKLNTGIQSGAQASIIFDQDYGKSTSYNTSTRPPRQILKLQVGDLSCSANQEIVNGQCANICPTTQIRNSSGVCEAVTPTCSVGFELIKNQCVIKCAVGQTRETNGNCIAAPASVSVLTNSSAANSPNSTVSSSVPNCNTATQDLVNAQCVAKCGSGQARDTTGRCNPAIPTCAQGEELVNNKCLITCPSGQNRSGETCAAVIVPTGQTSRTGGAEIFATLAIFIAGIGVYFVWTNAKKKVEEVNIVAESENELQHQDKRSE